MDATSNSTLHISIFLVLWKIFLHLRLPRSCARLWIALVTMLFSPFRYHFILWALVPKAPMRRSNVNRLTQWSHSFLLIFWYSPSRACLSSIYMMWDLPLASHLSVVDIAVGHHHLSGNSRTSHLYESAATFSLYIESWVGWVGWAGQDGTVHFGWLGNLTGLPCTHCDYIFLIGKTCCRAVYVYWCDLCASKCIDH